MYSALELFEERQAEADRVVLAERLLFGAEASVCGFNAVWETITAATQALFTRAAPPAAITISGDRPRAAHILDFVLQQSKALDRFERVPTWRGRRRFDASAGNEAEIGSHSTGVIVTMSL